MYKQPPEVFYKKGVLKNFTKLTGKHLRQSLFFNKDVGLTRATLLKKRLNLGSGTGVQVFFCKFYEISKNTFFRKHLHLRFYKYLPGTLNFCKKLQQIP